MRTSTREPKTTVLSNQRANSPWWISVKKVLKKALVGTDGSRLDTG
jgi:hypothetical protein